MWRWGWGWGAGRWVVGFSSGRPQARRAARCSPGNLVNVGMVIALPQSLATAERRARPSQRWGISIFLQEKRTPYEAPLCCSATSVTPWAPRLGPAWPAQSSALSPLGQASDLPASGSLLGPVGLTQRGGDSLRLKCMLFYITTFLLHETKAPKSRDHILF